MCNVSITISKVVKQVVKVRGPLVLQLAAKVTYMEEIEHSLHV